MKARAFLLAAALAGAALGARAQAPAPEAAKPATVSALRPDERRGDRVFGLSWEATQERRLGFDLDASVQGGRDVQEHEIKADALWRPADSAQAFVQAVVLAETRRRLANGSVQKQHSLERGQTWLLFEAIGGTPVSLQLGRVAIVDRRAWWWDDDLDALRLIYAVPGTRVDTGFAREVLKLSSRDRGIAADRRGVTRWFGHASQDWGGSHQLEAFWLLQRDGSGAPAPGALFADGEQDASDARLHWLGLRASGEQRLASGHRVGYRIDAAVVGGRESLTPFEENDPGLLVAGATGARTVRGRAWDAGLYWRLPGGARPTFNLAWAQGSGGVADATQDRNFRQTGLHENKGRMGGVKRIRFYGELLSPDLSNLSVASAGFGVRVLPASSVELLVHRYRQQVASTRVAGSRLAADPLGESRDLGREVDLLLASREWQNVELTLLLAAFKPGAAFGPAQRDSAHAVEFGITFTY